VTSQMEHEGLRVRTNKKGARITRDYTTSKLPTGSVR
jgi:hypothetical protein